MHDDRHEEVVKLPLEGAFNAAILGDELDWGTLVGNGADFDLIARYSKTNLTFPQTLALTGGGTAAVPEPSTFVVLALAMGGAVIVQTRKRKNAVTSSDNDRTLDA